MGGPTSRYDELIQHILAEPGQWWQMDDPKANATNFIKTVWRRHHVLATASVRQGVLYARIPEENPCPTT